MVPPLLYEAAINVEKQGRVVTRIGTIILYQLLVTFLVIPSIYLLVAIQGFNINFNFIILLAVIIQLNDYSGTLEPYVSFVMRETDTLAFLGFSALARNSVLLFLLANMMPNMKSSSSSVGA